MTGLEGNQQAEQDVQEYSRISKQRTEEEEADEMAEEEYGQEEGEEYVDHIQMQKMD